MTGAGSALKTRGINYDTGFVVAGADSRPVFDEIVVAREMEIIANDLHCNAVRISGARPERIEIAARSAAEVGLEVWFAPFPIDVDLAEVRDVVLDSAERAERLRRDGADVVLMTGCELSLFARGILPGDSLQERIAVLTRRGLAAGGAKERTVSLLAELAQASRREFAGRVSYASGIWEDIDWSGFDIVGVDAYRDAGNAHFYAEMLRREHRHGKPVSITEFGCCTYVGAGARGGLGWFVGDLGADPRFDGSLHRDEGEQVTYLNESLAAFERAGIDSAFWFTFASYTSPHRDDPRRDEDLAAYAVVAALEDGSGTAYPEMPWEPKLAFEAIAAAYG